MVGSPNAAARAAHDDQQATAGFAARTASGVPRSRSVAAGDTYLEERTRSSEPRFPLAGLCFFFEGECFLVQLEEWESPENIFGDYAYFSSLLASLAPSLRRITSAIWSSARNGSQSKVV